jgi:hypothetical protein
MLATDIALAILSLLTPVQVHFVDDDGGPGVHFLEIADAIASAQPGDTIVVAPGTYAPFTLAKALTILGTGDTAQVAGVVRIESIASGEKAALVRIYAPLIEILGCDGAVVVQEIPHLSGHKSANRIDVKACEDVRLWRTRFSPPSTIGAIPNGPGLSVEHSRVEVLHSQFVGGTTGVLPTAPGIRLAAGASAHLADVNATGAYGAQSGFYCLMGGAGLSVAAGATALAERAVFTGGLGGWAYWSMLCDEDAPAGPGISNLGALHMHDVHAYGDWYYFGVHCFQTKSPAKTGNGAYLDVAPPGTAVLRIDQAPTAGGRMLVQVTGEPHAVVRLRMSRELVPGTVAPTIGELVVGGVQHVLGTVGPTGRLSASVRIPANWAFGDIGAIQAEVDGPTGLLRTNSIPIVVR